MPRRFVTFGSLTHRRDPRAHPLDRTDLIVLALLIAVAVVHAWAGGQATAVQDSWRDFYFAELIASGQAWPVTGPVIGNIGHLGPVWYYLLAPAFALGGATAVLMLVGLLAGLKYPLAYLLGRRLGGERAVALLFAVALAMPGWFMFELLWPTHTSTVVSALLAFALLALGYRRRPSLPRALGLGLGATLLLHAHPTTLLLGTLVGAAALSLPTIPHRRRLLHALAAATIAALPLLPHVLAELSHPASADWLRVQDYVDGGLQSGLFERMQPLLAGLLWHGPAMMHRLWLGGDVLGTLLLGAHALALGLAAIGLPLAARRPAPWIVLGLLLLQSLFVLLLRPITPFWMAYAHAPLLAALLALGLAALWRRGGWLRSAIGIAAGGYLIGAGLLLRFVANPAEQLTFPQFAAGSPGMMSVASVPSGRIAVANPRLPAQQMAAIGARLCAPVTVYGHLAALVDESFGVGVRSACGQRDQVVLGGPANPARPAIIGLTRPARRAAGLDAERGDWLELHPVDAVWSAAESFRVVAAGAFPPRDLSASAAVEFTIEGRAPHDAAIVVATRAAGHHRFDAHAAERDGRTIPPAFRDSYVAVYRCDDCAAGPGDWTLRVTGPPAYVDVLVVRP